MAHFKHAHELERGDVILGTDEGRKNGEDEYGQILAYPETSGDVLRVLTDGGVHYMHPATLVMVRDFQDVIAEARATMRAAANDRRDRRAANGAIHGLGHHVAPTTPQPEFPAGTPEYAAYAAQLRAELKKFANREAPYDNVRI